MYDTRPGRKHPARPALAAGDSGDADLRPPSGTTPVEVHQLPAPDAATGGHAHTGRSRARRARVTRLLAETALFAVLAGVAFGVSDAAAPRSTQPAKPGQPHATIGPGAQARAAPPPRIVAPRSTIPGAPIQLLVLGAVPGARRPHVCGRVELRFDTGPVQHSVQQALPDTADDYGTAAVAIMTLPTSTASGRHEIALYAPIPGGSPGQPCADTREHQAPIATAPIIITGDPR